jgi:hypothetical protein
MADWPPPVSAELVERQRQYRDFLDRKLGTSRVAKVYRQRLNPEVVVEVPSVGRACGKAASGITMKAKAPG